MILEENYEELNDEQLVSINGGKCQTTTTNKVGA